MAQAVALSGADYIEVRVEESSVTRIHFIGPEIEQLGETTELGGCVRACKNGGWGFSSFNDLSQLMDQARTAIDMAGRVGKDKTHLASVEPIISENRIKIDRDPRNISLDDKFLLCQGYNDILMSGDKIQTSIVRYEDQTKSKYFTSSEGSLSYQEGSIVWTPSGCDCW